MKTLGRILVILTVTALVTAALYLVFNSLFSGTSSNFRPGDGQFQPGGSRPDLGAVRYDFGGRVPDGDGEREGSVAGLLFGGIKNGLVIGVIVWQSSSCRKELTGGGGWHPSRQGQATQPEDMLTKTAGENLQRSFDLQPEMAQALMVY